MPSFPSLLGIGNSIQFQAASRENKILPSHQQHERIKPILSPREHAESISTIKPLRQSVHCVIFPLQRKLWHQKECHSEGSLSPKCRDESIRQTLDFHLPIDVMWQRKDFRCLNKFWYFYDVRRYTCLTALVVVYISAPKPSGLDALDPSLPPSNNSQNVVEENSTTQCHLKDGAILSVDLPPTNLLITNFIASTQYDNIVAYDASKERRSIQAEEPSSSVRLHLPFSRINESIPKAQVGYVHPSTPSNARVMSHATPLNIIQNSIQLTALILSNIFSPWWKMKHDTPRTPLCWIYPPCSI